MNFDRYTGYNHIRESNEIILISQYKFGLTPVYALDVCKNDAEFLIDEKTKMPRICTPGAFIACPAGYRCHKSSTSSQHGFCCKGDINAPIGAACSKLADIFLS